ncbi:MAG: AAA family ATPase [Casimicrobiaceae bacterium]
MTELFRDKVKVGDLFYLVRDAEVILLGRITSEAAPFAERGAGWLSRTYEVLRHAEAPTEVRPGEANWQPTSGSVFTAIGPTALSAFQRTVLRPVFQIDLQVLEELRNAAQEKILEVVLTQGAIEHGYLAFQLSASVFPESSYGDASGDSKGTYLKIVTEYGGQYDDDIRVEGNAARPRSRFGTYYKKSGAKVGDRIRISGTPSNFYLMRLVPAGTGLVSPLTQLDVTPMPKASTLPTSLNVILYGPPGTGKTFLTAERAVQICDGAAAADRTELMGRYSQLYEAGRISFVTFHQSFSYEDFVEGIRPEVNDQGQISYDVRDGVFKRVCDVARERNESQTAGASIDLQGRKLFKMSLGNTLDPSEADIFERCIEEGVLELGYGSDLDYTGCDTLAAVRERFRAAHPDPEENTDYNVTAVHYLKNEVRTGDLVLISDGNFKFRAIGEVTGEYRFVQSDAGHYQTRPVRWLKVLTESLPIETVFNKRLSQMTIYLMDQKAVKWEALKALLAPPASGGERQNYVLIIDEINRANISKTLGELLTLLEPDKRLDAVNPLKVKLPYSGKDFGVPSNLFIIGTMNTADRSIALLDTALRRRFEFVELRPRPDLLKEDVDGVNLRLLLDVLNQRVEFLFDREHTIGHAFLLEVTTLDKLRAVFRLKIIPLLQEYFYEDWDKVGAALNDDGTSETGFLLVDDLPIPAQMATRTEDFRLRRRHRVNPNPFPLAAFRRIYE